MDTATDTAPTGSELVIFEQHYTPAALFVPGAADPLICRIKSEIAKEVTDPSTDAGRKRIVSLAMKVTKTKTAIDAARKTLVADEKKRLAAIDAEGRRIWDELEALAKEVRQPVTDWENRDKERVAAHEAGVAAIKALAEFDGQPTTDQIAMRLFAAEASDTSGYEEFATVAAATKDQVVDTLTARLAASRQADSDRAELERLRKEAAEREQREREERIAAQARAEAEAAAEQERQRIQREAEEKERAAAEQAARAKREKEEAEARAAKAEAERIEAERRAKEAAEAAAKKAEEDRIAAEKAAAERERQRIEAEQRAEAEAARQREADKEHRAKVNRDALAALVVAGLTEEAGKQAISAIAKGLVPNVKISY